MRDRIAASAREKLSQVDKEKQLQAERKRKAAMFINLLKSNNTEAGAAEANDVAMGRWTYFRICKYSKTSPWVGGLILKFVNTVKPRHGYTSTKRFEARL